METRLSVEFAVPNHRTLNLSSLARRGRFCSKSSQGRSSLERTSLTYSLAILVWTSEVRHPQLPSLNRTCTRVAVRSSVRKGPLNPVRKTAPHEASRRLVEALLHTSQSATNHKTRRQNTIPPLSQSKQQFPNFDINLPRNLNPLPFPPPTATPRRPLSSSPSFPNGCIPPPYFLPLSQHPRI